MKMFYSLDEIEKFFTVKYKGTVLYKDKSRIELCFSDKSVFIYTEQEKHEKETLKSIFSNCSDYLGFSIFLSEEKRYCSTIFGSCFHLFCLISLLVGDNTENLFKVNSCVLEYANSEIKDFFN